MKTFSHLLLAATLAVLNFTASAQSWLTNGLVAYYPFNGNANDESGKRNHGTVNGASLSSDQFGRSNNAYSFDGTNNFIELPQTAVFDSQDYTVSLWFNAARFPDSSDHEHEAASLISRGRDDFEVHIGAPPFADTGIRFLPRLINANTGQHWDARTTGLQTNRWQHLVATYERSLNRARVFLNGEDLVLDYLTGNDGPPDNRPARLGVRYGGGIPFQGRMNSLRIYNRALSSSEVAQLFAVESAPPLNIKKAVYVDSDHLKVGTNYQLQVTTDLNSWINYGSPFTATNSAWRTTNYWDVDNWNKLFFRLQIAP